MTPKTEDSINSQRPLLRLEITLSSVLIILSSIGLAVLAAEILVSARRVLAWVVACAVIATLIEIIVQWLGRWMKRPLALIFVFTIVGVSASALAFGAMHDLDREVNDIKSNAPVAAGHLERSERFGNIAREIHLQERIKAGVQRLSQPSSGLAGEAVSSIGTYTICIVLTILFLSWGPNLARGVLSLLEESKAERTREIALLAFSRSRRYVFLALIQAAIVGFIGWIVCQAAQTPAPLPLALALAAFSLVPNLGILIGSIPILLLTLGLSADEWGIRLTLLFIALQTVSTLFIQPTIVKRSQLYVGPAITSIAGLFGFELYGIGGALYGTALVILTVALIDSKAEVVDQKSAENKIQNEITKY